MRPGITATSALIVRLHLLASDHDRRSTVARIAYISATSVHLALCWLCLRSVKLEFHETDTDMDFLADFRARILARKSPRQADCRGARGSRPSAARAARQLPRRARPVQLADKVRGLLSDARFSSRGCPLGMRACTRVRVPHVHDKLSCTHLQNYTIGASLKSVSVSVPWNSSLNKATLLRPYGVFTIARRYADICAP